MAQGTAENFDPGRSIDRDVFGCCSAAYVFDSVRSFWHLRPPVAAMDARAAEAEEESSAEALERAVSRIVCSQAALELGFSAARASALDLLVAALHRFLAESAHRAHEAAESAGRASTALPDVLRALAGGEGMGVDIAQLIDHVRACAEGEAREVPFAQPLGSYPARKRLRGGGGALTYAEVAGAAAPPHLPLPSWLPVLPEAHTYVRSAQHAAAQTLEAAARDGRVKRELAAQTVGAEAALSALADAQAPGCATDYAATAPGRWGGALGGGRALALRAAAEQETALAEAEPEAAARNPYVRAAGRGGAALDAGYTAELLQGVGGAAPAASALALPAAGEGEAGWAGEGGGAGAQAARCV